MSRQKDDSKVSRKRKSSQENENVTSKKSRTKGGAKTQSSFNHFLSATTNVVDSSLATLFSAGLQPSINEALLSKTRKVDFPGEPKNTSSDSESDEDNAVPEESNRSRVSSNLQESPDVPSDDADSSDPSQEGQSEDDESSGDATDQSDSPEASAAVSTAAEVATREEPKAPPPKRRKANEMDNEDLEANYMSKLARESEAQRKREVQSQRRSSDAASEGSDEGESREDDDAASSAVADDSTDDAPPPLHESLAPKTDQELEKAQRTVFLGNVSTEAIKSKTARKALDTHLTSFFTSIKKATVDAAPSLTSLRFRSTPFASAIPKRAAFARKEVMDATSHSTNAYAVYSTAALARAACKRLNGTIILDRHLRVDSVAHPSPIDHRRCVFVGNLGFVDDESLIDAADTDAAGKPKRKGNKVPSDTEEGLWRTFGKCGTVESVRVVRDPKTRVGKGFAYVQFDDENAVEAALLYDEKKFPPMLPRKLRVMRAKAVKRNKKPGGPTTGGAQGSGRGGKGGYVPKLTPQQRSQMGRTAKLYGKSAAGQSRRGGPSDRQKGAGADEKRIKAPESFVFEGHRARSGTGNAGIKMKKGTGRKALPTKNSKKRGAAWKAKNGKA